MRGNLRYCKVRHGLNNLASLPVKRIQALLISAYATMSRSDTRVSSEGERKCTLAADFALSGSDRRSDYIFILLARNYFRRRAINAPGLRKLECRWKINVLRETCARQIAARDLFRSAKLTSRRVVSSFTAGSAVIHAG